MLAIQSRGRGPCLAEQKPSGLENGGLTYGKPMENLWKTYGKPMETSGKWWFNMV